MTADTSKNDSNRNSDAKNVLEHSNKHLVAIVLVIIFAAIVLNKVGILNFNFGEHNNDESTEKTQSNENPANTDENSATTENDSEKSETNPIKTETLYDRYTKKPMRYYQYDPSSLTSEYRIEVFNQFRTWLLGKLPPGIEDINAICKVNRLHRIKDKLIVYNSPNLPENPAIPDNWLLTNDSDKNCVLFVIIPPSKSPLPPEFGVKFIVHEDNVGKIYNFGLRQSVKRGFIWKFYGISFE